MKRLILIAMLAAAAQAQVLTGSLVGDVTDASGAAVPGATVKITQAAANLLVTSTNGVPVVAQAAIGTRFQALFPIGPAV